MKMIFSFKYKYGSNICHLKSGIKSICASFWYEDRQHMNLELQKRINIRCIILTDNIQQHSTNIRLIANAHVVRQPFYLVTVSECKLIAHCTTPRQWRKSGAIRLSKSKTCMTPDFYNQNLTPCTCTLPYSIIGAGFQTRCWLTPGVMP